MLLCTPFDRPVPNFLKRPCALRRDRFRKIGGSERHKSTNLASSRSCLFQQLFSIQTLTNIVFGLGYTVGVENEKIMWLQVNDGLKVVRARNQSNG